MGGIAPSRVPAAPGEVITITGEDRMDVMDIKKGASVMRSLTVTPSISARLGTISKAYQRIRWDMVEFYVTPQASAITNGGYVAGIVMDPSDEHVTAADLSATQGAQTKKWYETALIRMPAKTDLLYTSSGSDPRLSQVGRLWIISEGKPSSDLTVVVTFRWRVTLSQPTVETGGALSFILTGDFIAKAANYNISYRPHCSDTAQDDCSDIIPIALQHITGLHFFRVPTFTIEYHEGTGDTGTMQMHFCVYNTVDKKMYYSSDGKNIDKTVWQGDVPVNQILIPEGTYMKYTGQGNQC